VKNTTINSSKALGIPRLFFLVKNGSLIEGNYQKGQKNGSPKDGSGNHSRSKLSNLGVQVYIKAGDSACTLASEAINYGSVKIVREGGFPKNGQ
jgi:hypothetical protein